MSAGGGPGPRRFAMLAALLSLLPCGGAWRDAQAHGPPLTLPVGTDAAAGELPEPVATIDLGDRDVVLQLVDRLQYAHRFVEAEALVSRLLERRAEDGLALLQRSQLRIALGRGRGALADCLRASSVLDALAASACQAQAEAALGRVAAARELVEAALARHGSIDARDEQDTQTASWAEGIAAELATQSGDAVAAEHWHRAALRDAGTRHFPRLAYAEFMLAQRRPAAALELLADAGAGTAAIELRRRALRQMAETAPRVVGGAAAVPAPVRAASGASVQQASEATGPRAFFRLGIEHLLGGTDHLAFLALLLLGSVGAPRTLVAAASVVTAFTVAHSVTLALAVTGWLRLPVAPVEVAIAASIVATAALLLRTVLRNGPAGTGHWILAFGFGLVHGLGFANVLAGLLDDATLTGALVAFNLGLETAQLGIVLLAAPVVAWLARRPAVGRPVITIVAAGIGVLGCTWIVERLP